MHNSEILVTTEKYRKLHAPKRLKISSCRFRFCEPIDTKPKFRKADAQQNQAWDYLRPEENPDII